MSRFEAVCGDCLAVMPTMAENSVDSVVTDPPYGLSFMGRAWDHGVPGVEFWKEALRVAKPGAHLLAFGGTRTFHRLACAIEDAGWEVRDCVMWVYGTGFPKSMDVGKAMDAEGERSRRTTEVSVPVTEDAKRWDGWGTALKPAWEPIIVARKPLEGTVVANVLKWGTGALNVDGCRVETKESLRCGTGSIPCRHGDGLPRSRLLLGGNGNRQDAVDTERTREGRWPANVVHDGSLQVMDLFPDSKSTGGVNGGKLGVRVFGKYKNEIIGANAGGLGDSGSAGRFFYCAKVSKAERNRGLDGEGTAKNCHPTMKPVALMRWLCRLVMPPGGTVLDPFMGSGSTGCAALAEGFRFVGVDLDRGYCDVATERMEAAASLGPVVGSSDEGDK